LGRSPGLEHSGRQSRESRLGCEHLPSTAEGLPALSPRGALFLLRSITPPEGEPGYPPGPADRAPAGPAVSPTSQRLRLPQYTEKNQHRKSSFSRADAMAAVSYLALCAKSWRLSSHLIWRAVAHALSAVSPRSAAMDNARLTSAGEPHWPRSWKWTRSCTISSRQAGRRPGSTATARTDRKTLAISTTADRTRRERASSPPHQHGETDRVHFARGVLIGSALHKTGQPASPQTILPPYANSTRSLASLQNLFRSSIHCDPDNFDCQFPYGAPFRL
jgi:hypothetical protein